MEIFGMKNIKNKLLAETGINSESEPVDAGRRQALTRLGLTAAIAYAAPTLLPLRKAAAHGGSDGGNDNGGSDNGNDDGTAGTDPSDGTNPTDPSDGTNPTDPSDGTDPTDPTDATSPSE
jgi:hypothetical protein